MNAVRHIVGALLVALLATASGASPDSEALLPVQPHDPAWRALAERLANPPDGAADFEETRTFRFRSQPTRLAGVARVSSRHGLSLEYTQPEARIVIVDQSGVLLREKNSDRAAPGDPRARAMNDAMRHILGFDLAALAETFELRGQAGPDGWRILLTPRTPQLARAVAGIEASGDEHAVRRIVVTRSERNVIEIRIDPPRPVPGGFSVEEIRKYFRAAP